MDTIQTNEGVKRNIEFVQTLRADGRPGESIPKSEYDTWSYFILSTLAKSNELTLTELLEKADQQILANGGKSDTKISWYVLQVKRDLEARGLIKVIQATNRKHSYVIQLTRQGISKIHYEFQVSAWSNEDNA
jgi:hypothetical protein